MNVAAGKYRGGFTIDKDLTLNGAGAQVTTISGGGPVITVGAYDAASEPSVAIRGVTITGGATRSSFGVAYMALGGGVWAPPAANGATGATLTITNNVITRNTAEPATAVDAGFSCGPTGDCQFAQAGGGGIDSWGDVTLDTTTVSNNEAAGPVTSDADGAGIYSQQGTLTMDNSVVTGNRTIASTPNGRFAEGAGIMFDTFFSAPNTCFAPAPACALVVRNSVVSDNHSTLTNTLPSFAGGQVIGMDAKAGLPAGRCPDPVFATSRSRSSPRWSFSIAPRAPRTGGPRASRSDITASVLPATVANSRCESVHGHVGG